MQLKDWIWDGFSSFAPRLGWFEHCFKKKGLALATSHFMEVSSHLHPWQRHDSIVLHIQIKWCCWWLLDRAQKRFALLIDGKLAASVQNLGCEVESVKMNLGFVVAPCLLSDVTTCTSFFSIEWAKASLLRFLLVFRYIPCTILVYCMP